MELAGDRIRRTLALQAEKRSIHTSMSNSQSDDSKDRAGSFFHHAAVDPSDLKPADHIYVYRALGVYSHHGIYTGNHGREVIHFTGDSFADAYVQASTVDEFCDDGTLHLVAYDVHPITKYVSRRGTSHWVKSHPADEVISTAKYYLRHPDEWGDYNLLFNNCESFAVYCKIGIRISDQVVPLTPW